MEEWPGLFSQGYRIAKVGDRVRIALNLPIEAIVLAGWEPGERVRFLGSKKACPENVPGGVPDNRSGSIASSRSIRVVRVTDDIASEAVVW